MRNILIWIYIFISCFLWANNHIVENTFIGSISNGFGKEELHFDSGRAGGPHSPICFYIDEYGNTLTVVEQWQRKIKEYSLNNVEYLSYIDISKKVFPFEVVKKVSKLTKNIYIGNGIYSGFFIMVKDFEDLLYMDRDGILYGDRIESYNNYFPLGDKVYYYNQEGYVGAIDEKGNLLTPEQALTALKDLNNEYIETNNLSGRSPVYISKMRDSGKAIVLGNRYYSTSVKENFDFYNITGSEIDYYEKYKYNINFIGYDDDHNSYWTKSIKIDEHVVYIFSETGQLLNTFSYDSMSLDKLNDEKPSVFVTEVGNIYFMFPHQDGTRFCKVNRTWGEPSLVAIAINGLEGDSYSKYVMEVLATMDKDQLRILRNTMFAMEGYKFKSKELTMHFNQFEWYKPNESVQASASNLSEAQQKLIEEIWRLEQE